MSGALAGFQKIEQISLDVRHLVLGHISARAGPDRLDECIRIQRMRRQHQHGNALTGGDFNRSSPLTPIMSKMAAS